MTGAARPPAHKQRDPFANSGAVRPTPAPGKRKRPDAARSTPGIENSGNAAAAMADADPYDIMSFDGWTDTRDRGPSVQRTTPSAREPARRRAVGVKNKAGPTKGPRPSAETTPLPQGGSHSGLKDEAAKSAAEVRRGDQARRRQPEGKPVAPAQAKPAEASSRKRRASPASTDALVSRRRATPDFKDMPLRKRRASPDPKDVPSRKRRASPDIKDVPMRERRVTPEPKDVPLRKRRASPDSTDAPLSRGLSRRRVSPNPTDAPPAKRRASPASTDVRPRSRRLIDALADQAIESSDEEAEDAGPPPTARADPIHTPAKGGIGESPSVGPGTDRVVKTPASVKFTYGSQRSILQAAGSGDPLADISLMPPLPTSIPETPSGAGFSFEPEESDDDETAHKGAIRSIHELRQAGANNRFADEIDDLLERVGTPKKGPLSLRRNALLEVAVKLHEKQFLRQFRDYDTNGRLFDDLAREDDVVSGFALVSALLTLLAANAAPRASRYLQSGMSRLLRKLLRHGDDIVSIAGQRSTNMSRSSRGSVASLKTAMLKLDVWETKVASLSPRTLSLNLMRVAFGSPDGPACMEAFETLAGDLFSILQLVPQPDYLEECSDVEKADCSLVSSVLQELSVGAVPAGEADGWATHYPDIISAALDATLQRGARLPEPFEASLLKLAMNCTNNNPPAASVWHQTGRLGNVARSACTCFRVVKDDVLKGEWNADAYNRLLLVLGLMINLCEHAPSSEGSLEADVLDDLIRVYLESYSSTTEVRYYPTTCPVIPQDANPIRTAGRLGGEDTAERGGWLPGHRPGVPLPHSPRPPAPREHGPRGRARPPGRLHCRVHRLLRDGQQQGGRGGACWPSAGLGEGAEGVGGVRFGGGSVVGRRRCGLCS